MHCLSINRVINANESSIENRPHKPWTGMHRPITCMHACVHPGMHRALCRASKIPKVQIFAITWLESSEISRETCKNNNATGEFIFSLIVRSRPCCTRLLSRLPLTIIICWNFQILDLIMTVKITRKTWPTLEHNKCSQDKKGSIPGNLINLCPTAYYLNTLPTLLHD
jgi:hypothetical protein